MKDYQSLAEVRYQIRRFLHFSEEASRSAGLEPRQYQLMLALKGLPPGVKPRIGELAERMQILHHSAVELVNRLERGGFVRRQRGGEDRREVLLTLTAKGESTLRELALHHRAELRSSAPALLKALKRVVHRSKNGQSGVPRSFAKRKNRTRRTAKNTWHRRKKSRAAV